MHALTRAAFGGYTWLRPPSGAINESEDDVRRDLAAHGGVLARLDGAPVAAARFVLEPRLLHVRRVAVDPARQGTGIGRELMLWVERHARERGFREVRLGVRAQLPGNRAFYERLGYRVVRSSVVAPRGEPVEHLELELTADRFVSPVPGEIAGRV